MSDNAQQSIEQATTNIQTSFMEIFSEIGHLQFAELLQKWIIPYGLKLLLSILIYYVGKMLARMLSHVIARMFKRSTNNEMLESFVQSISYALFLLITIIAALSHLGINTTSLVALIGAAGLAVSLSLQNSLQNFAAGVMILIFRPFKHGDYIEAGNITGYVEQMGLLLLELRTADNKAVLVPNGTVFSNSITNYSRNATRRIDLIFDIAYEDDIEQAKAIIERCVQAESRILKEPKTLIAVGNLAASSVQIFVRPWVKTGDVSSVQFALLEMVKIEFDKAGISIPFNQLDVHFPDQNVLPNQSI